MKITDVYRESQAQEVSCHKRKSDELTSLVSLIHDNSFLSQSHTSESFHFVHSISWIYTKGEFISLLSDLRQRLCQEKTIKKILVNLVVRGSSTPLSFYYISSKKGGTWLLQKKYEDPARVIPFTDELLGECFFCRYLNSDSLHLWVDWHFYNKPEENLDKQVLVDWTKKHISSAPIDRQKLRKTEHSMNLLFHNCIQHGEYIDIELADHLLESGVCLRENYESFSLLDCVHGGDLYKRFYSLGLRKNILDRSVLNLMSALGYKMPESGFCNAFAYKCCEAVILEDDRGYDLRLEKIMELVTRLEFCGRFVEEEGNTKYLLFENREISVDFDTMLKARYFDSSLEDYWEIRAFFDSLHIYYRNSRFYPELFIDQDLSKSHFNRHRTFVEEAPELAYSLRIEEMGGVVEVIKCSLVLNQEMLVVLLNDLKSKLLNGFCEEKKPRIPLQLNIKSHSICIAYLPSEDSWLYFNSNFYRFDRYRNADNLVRSLFSDCFESDWGAVILRGWFSQVEFSNQKIASLIYDWRQTIRLMQLSHEQDSFINALIPLRSIEHSSTWLINTALCNDQVALDHILSFPSVNVNVYDYFQRTALMYATNYGYYETVLKLLDKQADPFVVSSSNWDCLTMASFRNYSNIVSLLISRGCSFEKSFLLGCQRYNKKIIDYYFEHESLFLNQQEVFFQALIIACHNNNSYLLEKVLDRLEDCERVFSLEEDLFMMCVHGDSSESLNLLIKFVLKNGLNRFLKLNDYKREAVALNKQKTASFLLEVQILFHKNNLVTL